MNKKVLSALLFGALMAGTGTFTSCIDTDEPAGIEQLRGAKAQLILAKVEVEKANAAYVLAEAEYQKALAAHEQANAAYRLAETKKKEAEAAAEEAKTEADKVYYQKLIAQYQLEMEQYAADHETLMVQKAQALADAKFTYETVLKQIAIAKALDLTEYEEITIEALETAVKTAYDVIYADGKLQDQIRTAEENLYVAMLEKAAGIGETAGVQDAYIPELELEVARAEAGVVAAEEKVAMLNELLDKDVESTDWRAEIETLNDSVDVLKLAVETKLVEIKKATATEEYLAADQKVNGVKNDKSELLKNGTVQDLADAIALYNANATGGTYKPSVGESKTVEKIKQALSKVTIEVNDAVKANVAKAVSDYNAEAEQDITAWNGTKFELAKADYGQAKYEDLASVATDYTYAPTKFAAEVAAWEAALEEAAVLANDTAAAQLELAGAQEFVADADTAHQEAVALWQVALNAKKGVATAVPTDYVSEDETVNANISGAVAAYNAAIATLATKVTAYNEAFTAAIESEFNKIKNEDFEKIYKNAMRYELETILGYSGVPSSGLLYTVSNLESFYASNSLLTDAQKKAENDKKAATKKQAQVDNAKNAIDNEEAWTTTATAKAADVKAVKDALDAIFNPDSKKGAQAAVVEVYGKLTTVLAAYETLANGIYAQALTADPAKVNFEIATGVGSEVEVGSTKHKVATGEWTAPNGNSFVVLRTAVSDENYGKIIATKLDESLADAAWKSTSKAAFGWDNRVVAPTEVEVREDGKALDTNYGTFGKYLAAKDALVLVEDRIAAAAKLEEVIAAVAEAKAAVEAEIAANDAKFAELLAAIEAADKANEEAKAELAKIGAEVVGGLNIELAQITAKKDAVEGVVKALQNAVSNHLTVITGATVKYEDAEAFEKDLKAAVEKAEDAVIKAEKAVLLAKKNLQLAEEGKYDNVADKQYALDKLNAELELAMAEYEEALANLEKALEIMSAE